MTDTKQDIAVDRRRSALDDGADEEGVTKPLRVAKKLRCHLGWHRWQRKRSDDGELYTECWDCGKLRQERFKTPVGLG